jgi:hypothetical protein
MLIYFSGFRDAELHVNIEDARISSPELDACARGVTFVGLPNLYGL